MSPVLLNCEREHDLHKGQDDARVLQKPISSHIKEGKHLFHLVAVQAAEHSLGTMCKKGPAPHLLLNHTESLCVCLWSSEDRRAGFGRHFLLWSKARDAEP